MNHFLEEMASNCVQLGLKYSSWLNNILHFNSIFLQNSVEVQLSFDELPQFASGQNTVMERIWISVLRQQAMSWQSRKRKHRTLSSILVFIQSDTRLMQQKDLK